MIGSTTWKKFPLIRYARLIIPSVILAVVSGCGTAKTIQQNVVVRDTIVITKERVLHDTLTIQKDTILYQDRVRVEVKWLEGNKVMVQAECPPDTIRIETIKIQNTIAPKNKKWSWEGVIGWSLAILCLLVLFRELVKGLVNKLF
jgi:hypothetical protein